MEADHWPEELFKVSGMQSLRQLNFISDKGGHGLVGVRVPAMTVLFNERLASFLGYFQEC